MHLSRVKVLEEIELDRRIREAEQMLVGVGPKSRDVVIVELLRNDEILDVVTEVDGIDLDLLEMNDLLGHLYSWLCRDVVVGVGGFGIIFGLVVVLGRRV